MSNTQLNPDDPKKEYTGVWIPKSVMECKDLSPIDKIVYGEIACFTKCYGSNKWLAERIGRSEVTASRSVNKLVRLGFVDFLGMNGNIRYLKAYQKRRGGVIKNDKAPLSKMTSIDKRRDNNLDIMDTNVSIGPKAPVENSVIRSQRSLEIDEAFRMWQEIMGYPLTPNKTDRPAVHNMLQRKDMDLDKLRMLILLVKKSQADRYKRFSITDFTSLRYKQNELIAWAHEKAAQQKVDSKVVEV